MKNITPLKINIEPENNGLEDDVPFPGGPYSQVNHVNLFGVQVRCSPAITCKPRFFLPFTHKRSDFGRLESLK